MHDDQFNLILQGNGINEGRGGEDILQALPSLPDTHLFVVGNGTAIPMLKSMIKQLNLTDRVTFVPRQTQEMLFNYTALADVGIALDHDFSPNFRFSLPNKIFEYIKAGTPQVVSNLPERARIVRQYQVGVVADEIGV